MDNNVRVLRYDWHTGLPTGQNGAAYLARQYDHLKYAEGMPSDFAKHHYQISKDSKAEVWITPAGEVKWGMTATISGNANAKVTKGNGTRAMLTFVLPSVLAPIEDPNRSIKMMRKVDLSDD